jgi:predicted DNA-binding ArsR family transcriptional regulator
LSIGQTQSSLNISLTKSEKELKEEIERVRKLIEEKQTSINNYQTLNKEVRYIYILLIYLKYYIERKHNCES